MVYTSLSTVTVNDFYRNLATSLGAQAAYRKTENFYAIQNEIPRLSMEKKKMPVIIIDKANYISRICNASLVIGNIQELNTITAETVMQTINDSTLG